MFGASGCTSTSDNVIPHFESGARAAGYNCVETVPPVDQVRAMRSALSRFVGHGFKSRPSYYT